MQLGDRFDGALLWCSQLHRTQQRKGSGIPYVAHLLSVAALVAEHGGDEDQVIAGLLHDAIEDTDVTEADVAERFGDRVAALVVACTDAEVVPKPPWEPRKRAYLAHLATVRADAVLVSMADKVHNARSIAADVDRLGEDAFAVFKGGADGTRWYYRRLADAYARRIDEVPAPGAGPGPVELLAELERVLGRFGVTAAGADDYDARPQRDDPAP